MARKSRQTSEAQLQEYFDQHVLKQIGKGSQMLVYGAGEPENGLVVKQFRSKRILTILMGLLGTQTPLDLAIKAHKEGKDSLGQHAIPYQMLSNPLELNIEGKKRVLHGAVVQEWANEEENFGDRLGEAAQCDTVDVAQMMLTRFIEFRRQLLKQRVAIHDPIPSNFVINDKGVVRLQDIGACNSGNMLVELNSAGPTKKSATSALMALRLRLMPILLDSEFADFWDDFKDQMHQFHDPIFLTQNVAKGVRKNRVPDVKIPSN